MSDIRKLVPIGKGNNHKTRQSWSGFDEAPVDIDIVKKEMQSVTHQLGTLGAGNHFIEIQKGDDGFIWFMLHSGSRNFGYRVANHFYKLAIEVCEDQGIDLPDKQLAYFKVGSKEYTQYKRAMEYALTFAKENRRRMTLAIHAAFSDNAGGNVTFDDAIDIHHNYAHSEFFFGESVVVHRKGATSAYPGELGIIPGSQGTASYIVSGKGNEDSFFSCSHGAGRKMGRGAAKRNLDYDAEVRKLDEQHIIHSIRGPKNLDEASGAYKDIEEVMEAQSDLVDIEVKLTPLGVIKG